MKTLPRETYQIKEFGSAFEKAAIGFKSDYSNMADIKLYFKLIW